MKDEFNRDQVFYLITSNENKEAISQIQSLENINHQDLNGMCLLHVAAQESNLEVTKELLQKGANPNIIDKYGNSPLWMATFNAKGNYEVVKLLIESKADPNHKNNAGRSPLDFAKQINDQQLANILTS